LIKECSSLIVPYFQRIIDIAFKLVAHDPNYLFTHDESAMDVDGENEQQDGWEEDEDGDWGDGFDNVVVAEDSDSTWKVRLASVYVLSAFIETKSEIFRNNFSEVFELIMSRFEERDANVRAEVFKTFCLLLRVSSGLESRLEDSEEIPDRPKLVRRMTSFATLLQNLSSITGKLSVLYNSDDAVSKKGVMLVLVELSKMCDSYLLGFLEQITPILIQSIVSSDSELRFNGLSVLRSLFLGKSTPSVDSANSASKFCHLENLTSAIIQALDDSFVKTRTLALLVIQALSRGNGIVSMNFV
jgi:hypothetical protein